MKVKILPALDDSYMYLVIDENTYKAAVVDPVEPKKVLEALAQKGAELTTILTTHHHYDRTEGISELVKLKKDLKVYGGDKNNPGLTIGIGQGDVFKIGSLHVKCFLTPCHTKGRVCYFVEDKSGGPPAVFTGDTLFLAGCGKFWEGASDQMYVALVEILGDLPDNTKVYCGNEYTVSNLLFAAHVEPNNVDVQKKLAWAKAKKLKGKPTVPSTIGAEKTFNPFMRVHEKDVQTYAGVTDPIAVMSKLRNEKNDFNLFLLQVISESN